MIAASQTSVTAILLITAHSVLCVRIGTLGPAAVLLRHLNRFYTQDLGKGLLKRVRV